jgi:catechol 2,3-dioxygenase-like lactoylglutathione lyase family enzyme
MSSAAVESPHARGVDMKLEVVVIPVSDVDRAKRFYGGLGWRLDADYASDDGYFRRIHFTPPGSGCSVIFGKAQSEATEMDTIPESRPTPSDAMRTSLREKSNRSPLCRNGNWKIASRDRRPKPAPKGPKCQKLPATD